MHDPVLAAASLGFPAHAGWQEPVTGMHDPVTGMHDPVLAAAGAQDEAQGGGFLPGFDDGSGGGDGGSGRGRRPRRLRIRWVAPLVAFIVILGALGAVGGIVFRTYEQRHANYTGSGTGTVTVQVKPGDTATLLAPRLVSSGVIKATDPFIAAAKDSSSLAWSQGSSGCTST